MKKELPSAFTFKSTEIGEINRKIEASVSDIVAGASGAIGRTISLARRREQILLARTAGKRSSG